MTRDGPELERRQAEWRELPTIVAVARKVTNQGSVAVINFFLGWTLIGWVAALAMACRTSRLVRDSVSSEIDGRRRDT